ncbi:hypothetical protein [Lysinibacillus sp. RS5]|uniref:hypothetical protein n=1 Tax=unclassified Lysinibacillus TaxID=2636778 RepID=UPI0035BE82C9
MAKNKIPLVALVIVNKIRCAAVFLAPDNSQYITQLLWTGSQKASLISQVFEEDFFERNKYF